LGAGVTPAVSPSSAALPSTAASHAKLTESLIEHLRATGTPQQLGQQAGQGEFTLFGWVLMIGLGWKAFRTLVPAKTMTPAQRAQQKRKGWRRLVPSIGLGLPFSLGRRMEPVVVPQGEGRMPGIQDVVSHIGGGVFKRIDENRELMALLQARCPQVLHDQPWIEGWLRSNDDFFVAVASVTQAVNPLSHFNAVHEGVRPFPRPWPVSSSQPQSPQ